MSFPEFPLQTVDEFLTFEEKLLNDSDLQDELVNWKIVRFLCCLSINIFSSKVIFLRGSIGVISDFKKMMVLSWRICVSDQVLACGTWLRPRPGDEDPLLFGNSVIQDVINRNSSLYRVMYFF